MTSPFDPNKAATLLGETDLTNISKLGEGNFTLRLTVEEETIQGQQKKNVKIELLDKSKFNGGKEYVMDSQTIKDFKTGADPKTVTLAGQEIKFDNLEQNFVNAIKPSPALAGKTIKTLDINLKNEIKKRTVYLQFSFIIHS